MAPPRMVYLAYPIDQIGGRLTEDLMQWYTWLEQAKVDLLGGGVDIAFDPGDAFKMRVGCEAGPELRNITQLSLRTADAVLAMMPLGLPSVGVPMDIHEAIACGKAVAVLTDVTVWMMQFGPEADYATFPLTEEGFGQAVTWLLGHERATNQIEYEPLPFMVVDGESMVDLTPRRTYEDDAGWDLVTSKRTLIGPGETVDVPCGIAVQLPSWAYGRITGRSSTLRKRNLLVNEGIIDTGWRGELFVCVKNMDSDPTADSQCIEAGERVGQLILHTNDSAVVRPIQVQDLVASERGTNGFGSTGQ